MKPPRRCRVLVAALTVVACGVRPRGFVDGAGPAVEDAGAGAPDATLGGPTLPCAAVHCSSDLHYVLDCHESVVLTCPPDQGCANGGCVAACESARANRTTIGCEFYAVNPDAPAPAAGGCYAMFVANTWSRDVAIGADYDGKKLDVASIARIPKPGGLTYAPLPGGVLPAGQVAVLFLARFNLFPFPLPPPWDLLHFDCPDGIAPAITTSDSAVHGTGRGQAFHVTTSAPTVAYDMFPYGGGQSAATSATLLLPTSAWDGNYIAVNAYRAGAVESKPGRQQPLLDLVAMQDATKVTINPTTDIAGVPPSLLSPGVDAAQKGVPHTYTLGRGEVLQIAEDEELTGSPVQADKPIGVWGGHMALTIPVDRLAEDTAHQQLPPIRALGHEYVAVRHKNRVEGKEESPPWRFVGVVDGTTLTYDPAAPPGAPAQLALGQIAEFAHPGPFVVRSQDDAHPFYVASYMTGASEVGPRATDDPRTGDARGDPEFVNVVPPAEYLASYVFFTDPTYPETSLVVVRTRLASGFKEVTLDCAGSLGGWTSVGSSGRYEYTRVDLVRGNFERQGACDNGRHEMRSEAPFGVTVWGWGSAASGVQPNGFFTQWVSYAYPAGMSLLPVNTVVVPVTPR
jgi:hypothetical protein